MIVLLFIATGLLGALGGILVARRLQARGRRGEPLDPSFPSGFLSGRAYSPAGTSIRRMQRHLNLVNRVAGEVIACHDQTGRITFVTPTAARILHHDPQDLIGCDWFDLVHPLDRTAIRGSVRDRVLRRRTTWRAHLRLRTGHGDDFLHVEGQFSPELDEVGEVIGFTSCLRDGSDRHRLERELREVNERAAVLDSIDDEVLASMSHELRTPLTVVMGFADLFLSTAGKEYRDMILPIRACAYRLRETIATLMNFLSGISRSYSVPDELVDVASEAAREASRFGNIAWERRITLKVRRPQEAVLARANARAISKITEQLVDNALKFTESGGEVVVSIERTEDVVRLRVSDTGIGIAPEFLPHIFKPFSQESTGAGRQYEGLGLGLAIVESLTDRIGGQIEVESIPGKGTAMTLRLTAEGEATPANVQEIKITDARAPSGEQR